MINMFYAAKIEIFGKSYKLCLKEKYEFCVKCSKVL